MLQHLVASAPGAVSSSTIIPTAPVSVLNSHLAFTAKITATADFPSTVPSNLQFWAIDAPFSSLVCRIGSFSFPSSSYGNWTVSGRRYSFLNNANGFLKLYSTNGRDLIQVVDIQPGATDISSASSIGVNLGNDIFFQADIAPGLRKLFKFDGTTITQISNTYPGNSDSINNLVACGSYVFFDAKNGAGRTKLFSTDGTTLRQLTDLDPGFSDTISFFPSDRACLNGRYYFKARNSSLRYKLYSSDGTNLVQIADINGAGNTDIDGLIFQVMGNRLYFSGSNGANADSKLFSTDGTDYIQITNIFAGDENFESQGLCNNSLYFLASTSVGGNNKLFSFDGTTLRQVSNTNATGNDDFRIACFKNEVYATSSETGGNKKFYKYDGVKLIKLMDRRPGLDDDVQTLYAADNFIFFVSKDESGNYQFYSYDGTIISQLSNLTPGGFCNGALNSSPFSGRYFAFCSDSSGAQKLYSTNGYDFIKHTDINGSGVDDFFTGGGKFEILGSGFAVLHLQIGVNLGRLFSICTDNMQGC